MKLRHKIGLSILCLLLSLSASAWEYHSVGSDVEHSAQLRFGANFTKKWDCGVRLGFNEDMRFDLYHTETGASFNHSYTTLHVAYAPIEFFKVDVGYILKIHGPNKEWSDEKRKDYNQWLRHRVFFSVTGSYKFTYLKLSLRERALLEMRTDSVNPLEKNKYNWQLRSRLGGEVLLPGQPVKPYAWVEVINTLNAPEYQQKYKNNDPTNRGHQYICNVRTQVGVKWRVSRLSSLDFYYRLTYGYNRDINITKSKGYIELEEEKLYQHAIGISYDLDW
ncbi:MAG: DUF2490 domain-containing protein [Paludibacteraceae bacterium]|nr:DUF2490 domain-containing protein [Paludibacteraceae bacterium]